MMTHDDRGEGGGVKNCQNGGDVICGCPLINVKYKEISWRVRGGEERKKVTSRSTK